MTYVKIMKVDMKMTTMIKPCHKEQCNTERNYTQWKYNVIENVQMLGLWIIFVVAMVTRSWVIALNTHFSSSASIVWISVIMFSISSLSFWKSGEIDQPKLCLHLMTYSLQMLHHLLHKVLQGIFLVFICLKAFIVTYDAIFRMTL